MSEAYKGTKYISKATNNLLADIAERNVHDVGPNTSGYNVNNNNLYEIMSESQYDKYGTKPENRKRLIPGDIVFTPNQGSGYHVAMVQNVIISNGDRDIEVSDIILIESTHDSRIKNIKGLKGLWGVGNKNDLSYYHNKDKNWIMGSW
ncbi:hypothetical protein EW093_05570 [Thiospirochaeta perfilievii]|uniref:Uncharacterized protein n=1 Tax=Thiospirochaeta perfilievii TaxID=252967 RepID=A0A5C1QC01_9SPIO|nr:hypothetical protein [Thiospirochaeta perfilievii]QEN04194.1 hypothetical protein EW093_05570 [Thiospirochaeta perfilievii]